VVSLSVTIRHADVLHFLGYPEDQEPPAQTAKRIQSLLVEARSLIEARGAVRHLSVEAAPEVGLEPVPAEGLVLGLVTVGDRIERRATELADGGEMTSALVLDAMGSAAVEEAADRLGAHVATRLRPSAGRPPTVRGGPDPASQCPPEPDGPIPSLSCRISPGYGDWPLTAQPRLFERLPHDEVGVILLSSLLMVPRKSISFAMWLGADVRPVAGLSGCDRCGLEHCRYRRNPGGGGSKE
jgi:hypothetical protein